MKFFNVLFGISLLFVNTVNAKFSYEEIPDPWTKDRSLIFDPENYLSPDQHEMLNDTIYDKIYQNVIPPCENYTKGYEMRLIVIDNMIYNRWLSDKENVAKKYSIYLHNKFKIGDKDCKNGILAFFAIEDRTFFVSVGKNVKKHLPNSFMESIMEDALPGISSGNYYSSFNYIIRQMNKYMNNHDAENQKKVIFIVLTVIGCLVGIAVGWCCIVPLFIYYVKYVYFYIRYRIRKRKVYKKLKKLDQDKEKVEKGNYITTTCPICLDEDLKPTEVVYTNCGHGFCKECLEEHKRNSDSCAICRKILSDPPETEGGSTKDNQLNELRTRLENLRRIYPNFISSSMVFDFGLPVSQRRDTCSNHDYFTRVRYRDYYQPEYIPIFVNTNNSRYHTFRTSSASSSFLGSSNGGGYSSGGVGGSW